MKRRYFKENKDILKFINRNKYNIIKIIPIIKLKENGFIKYNFISSYCVIYKNNI